MSGPIPEDFEDEGFVSADELGADGSTTIFTGAAVVSTTSTTKEIVLSNVDLFRSESLEAGDLVTLVGTGPADGDYTVAAVTGVDRFTVSEAIPDSTGGTCAAKYPAGSSRIGIDTSNFACTNATQLQQALADIDLIAGEVGSVDVISPGEVASIPTHRQMTVHEELRIDGGELRIDGRLFLEK